MERATRPLTEPRASRGLRRRLLRHYLPLALGSTVVLLVRRVRGANEREQRLHEEQR